MKRCMSLLSLTGALLMVSGCQEEKPAPPAADATSMAEAVGEVKSESGGHSHGSGPRGGAVADWGGGAYHVEFTVDHDAKKATVYVLRSPPRQLRPRRSR